jgi:internalin A
VLDQRDDNAERDATYWLQLIRSYARDVPVVVALNKSAGGPGEMEQGALEREYDPIMAWVATECDEKMPSSEQSIADLRAALTRAADGMHELRDRFPAKWWAIKEWLEEMDQPFLDFAAYQHRCQELGEADPGKQRELAAWLNDLGIAINYGADERLTDTTVLRHEWLANGIYAILRANYSHHSEPLAPTATISAGALGRIYAAAEKLDMLKAADYPAEKWPFLIRLMTLFQLGFPLDEYGRTLLVPALLPAEAPAGSEEPAGPEPRRLRYEFDVVPAPLLPRFLVRAFSLIEQNRCWRRGAILRYADSRARVWTTQDDRWIFVTAVGPESDRDELIMMIRGTLSGLFEEYRNLHVVEQCQFHGQWVPRRTLEHLRIIDAEGEQLAEVEQ